MAIAGCGGAPEARIVTTVPRAVDAPTDVERYDLGAGEVSLEADVKAGSAYTIRFPRARGSFSFSPTVPESSAVDVTVETSSAEASWDLVAAIARDRFLHVGQFPEARFQSRALRKGEGDGEGLTMFGDLDFHGVKKSVSVPLEIEHDRCRLRAACEFEIDRRVFGAVTDGALDALVSDSVTVRIQVDVARKGAPPGCTTE